MTDVQQVIRIMEVPSRAGDLLAYVRKVCQVSQVGKGGRIVPSVYAVSTTSPNWLRVVWKDCLTEPLPLHGTPSCSTLGRAQGSPSSWWVRCSLQSQHTHTETHVLHQQSTQQCFSGSDFIWSETLMQDLVVFIYFSLCFLVLDNIFAAAKGWWLPLLSRLSPESLLSTVSVVAIWILHFRRHTDEWSPRSWSHYNEHGAEITAKFTSTAH